MERNFHEFLNLNLFDFKYGLFYNNNYHFSIKSKKTKEYKTEYGYYSKFIEDILNNNFEKIPNTPEFVPEKGDIMVWNEKRGKGAGHVAICTGEGNTKEFYSYDLNWNNKKKVQKGGYRLRGVRKIFRGQARCFQPYDHLPRVHGQEP